jgi:hypothetical protein
LGRFNDGISGNTYCIPPLIVGKNKNNIGPVNLLTDQGKTKKKEEDEGV